MSDERVCRNVNECPCGEPGTTTVQIEWANGTTRYRYCEDCANDIVTTIAGVEILP